MPDGPVVSPQSPGAAQGVPGPTSGKNCSPIPSPSELRSVTNAASASSAICHLLRPVPGTGSAIDPEASTSTSRSSGSRSATNDWKAQLWPGGPSPAPASATWKPNPPPSAPGWGDDEPTSGARQARASARNRAGLIGRIINTSPGGAVRRTANFVEPPAPPGATSSAMGPEAYTG